jgi:CHASE1-domain containing sensor protein
LNPRRRPILWLQHQATAWIILALSFVVTALAWSISDSAIRTKASERFEFQTADIASAIERRLIAYATALRGGVGLFEAAGQVTRAQWHAYVEALRLQENFPGIQGLGFSLMIAPAELDAHIAGIRAEGFPDYSVRPEEPRDQYSAIVYLEPFDWRNQRAFGYDMYSEPVRRRAMERARDSGEPAISGRVTLVQETDEDVQYGFLMYIPVYRPGMPTTTLEERRAALLGFVYSPFRANDFMNGILGSNQDAIRWNSMTATPRRPRAFCSATSPRRRSVRSIRRPRTASMPWSRSNSSSIAGPCRCVPIPAISPTPRPRSR